MYICIWVMAFHRNIVKDINERGCVIFFFFNKIHWKGTDSCLLPNIAVPPGRWHLKKPIYLSHPVQWVTAEIMWI